LVIFKTLSPYVMYAACSACSIFLTEACQAYSFYSSCLNNFCFYILYIETI